MVSFFASNPWMMNLKGETDEEENEAVSYTVCSSGLVMSSVFIPVHVYRVSI